MAPSQQIAAVVTEDGVDLRLVDIPSLGRRQIRIKVMAAAQNPIDWMLLGQALNEAKYGGIVGTDYSGIVEELGPDVSEGERAVGEHVAGVGGPIFGLDGVFSQYVVTDAEYGIVSIPEGWSFEEAAQLGVTPLTALQCLHESLGLPSPFDVKSGPKRTLLIWGGASSIGQYAIQFAKLGGLHVITTASPKNFDLLKGLGADEVFDYRDENVVEKIRAATGNALDIAFDTISQGETQKQVTSAIGNEGGKVAAILPYENARPDVHVVFSNLPNLLKPESKAKWYIDIHRKIFATGKIKPNPILILPEGIAGMKGGLQYMQEGKVSAQKITYRIADTPQL